MPTPRELIRNQFPLLVMSGIAMLSIILLLSACTLTVGVEGADADDTPVPSAITTEAPTITETVATTSTAEPTVTETDVATATETATDIPTDLPTSTTQPPSGTSAADNSSNDESTSGSSGGADAPPRIVSFAAHATGPVKAGDQFRVGWEVENADDVRLCIIQIVPGAGSQRCFEDLPLQDDRVIDVTEETDAPLIVELTADFGQPDAVADSQRIEYDCRYEWFTTPAADLCPISAPVITSAAAEPFERGYMLYLADPGLYIVLNYDSEEAGRDGRYYLIYDPLTILDDTADRVSPPEGLYAPESGFGLVWRGDVLNGDYRGEIGWATEPEFGFTTTSQCDVATSQWQFCYINHPSGNTIVLHPLGSWWYQNAVR